MKVKFKNKNIPMKEMYACYNASLKQVNKSDPEFVGKVMKIFREKVQELKSVMQNKLDNAFLEMDNEVNKTEEFLIGGHNEKV